MINLNNTTLMIPIKIDSEDRLNNFYRNLQYLNFNFKTNIIIYEQGDFIYPLKNHIVNTYNNLNFIFLYDLNFGFFHKTKYTNKMLDIVNTPVVCIYDVDVIFDKDVYFKSQELIINNTFDMIYPFGKGFFQIEILKHAKLEEFLKNPTIHNILHHQSNFSNYSDYPFLIKYAEFGHASFFKTDAYRKLGGDNENFMSWGPEDQERFYRFNRLKLKITWLDNFIFHFDHERGPDSGRENPKFQQNEDLFEKIKKMNDSEFYNYYKNQEYYRQYKNIKFNTF